MPAVLSVDDMYTIEKYILNQNQNGNLSPETFKTINNQAQYEYMSYLLGDLRKYMNGRPIPPVAWGMTARVRESLTPFVYPAATLTVDPGTGNALAPSNYEMWDAMYWGSNKKRVKFIQQGRLDSHINSTINPISRNPVFLSIYSGFTVYPNNIGSVSLSYIRTPKDIIWGYTIGSGGRPVYNPATSQDPEWQRMDIMEVMARALRMVGVNLQAAQVSQYANEIKNVGQ